MYHVLENRLECSDNYHYITIGDKRRDICNKHILSRSVGHSKGHFPESMTLNRCNCHSNP